MPDNQSQANNNQPQGNNDQPVPSRSLVPPKLGKRAGKAIRLSQGSLDKLRRNLNQEWMMDELDNGSIGFSGVAAQAKRSLF